MLSDPLLPFLYFTAFVWCPIFNNSDSYYILIATNVLKSHAYQLREKSRVENWVYRHQNSAFSSDYLAPIFMLTLRAAAWLARLLIRPCVGK